jgi:molecular chaperone DnaJ
MPKNFYDVLGVAITASEDDIRRAYRKLALRLHPDHGRLDDTDFKEITKAYQVLRDPDKRSIYDRQFRSPIRVERQGSDLKVTLRVKIRELIQGIKRTIVIRRKGRCPSCNGTGSAEKASVKCTFCDGTGLQGFLLVLGQKKKCKICEGAGEIPKGDPCPRCKGIGLISEIVRHEIKLSPMVETVTIPGLGNCCNGKGRAGNLIVDLAIEDDVLYKTRGLNVATSIRITPVQAILGDKILLNVFGKEVSLTVPSGVQNGAVVEHETGGITFEGKTGTLKASIQIIVPTIISQTERELYEKILAVEKEESWPKILRF